MYDRMWEQDRQKKVGREIGDEVADLLFPCF